MTDTFALSVHATWRCRHSGACCSSGWPIPIDAMRRARIDAAVASGALARPGVREPGVSEPGVPEPGVAATEAAEAGVAANVVSLLGVTSDGHCVFHDLPAQRCGVQRALGHEALPLACRMFPRICLTDARGVRVSLSHYCPSAAARLFDDSADDGSTDEGGGVTTSTDETAPRLRLVRAPASFPAGGEYDGLDARDAFPPLLRPGVLLDFETADALEAFGIACFADPRTSPEAALDRFASICEALRAWRVDEGPLLARLQSLMADEARATGEDDDICSHADNCSHDDIGSQDDTGSHADTCRQDERWRRWFVRDAEVRGCVPADVACLPTPEPEAARLAHDRFVAPVWPAMARPVCRYLAARLFGGWCWYQGQGLRTVVRSLDAALAVVRIEAARQTMASGRMLDRDQMREAIRQVDLLILHLASRDALAARWSGAEREGLRP